MVGAGVGLISLGLALGTELTLGTELGLAVSTGVGPILGLALENVGPILGLALQVPQETGHFSAASRLPQRTSGISAIQSQSCPSTPLNK